MDHKHLTELQKKNKQEIVAILTQFNEKNEHLFNFSQFHIDEQWQKLWSALFAILQDSQLVEVHALSLTAIRILTRDEQSLRKADLVASIECLLDLADLSESPQSILPEINRVAPDTEQNTDGEAEGVAVALPLHTPNASGRAIMVEALKCLCNLIYQSDSVRRHCLKRNLVDTLLKRVTSPSLSEPSCRELYDLKLLFLMTALETDARNRMNIDLNGLVYLTEWLDEKLSVGPHHGDSYLDELSEMLKVMFNMTMITDKSPSESEIQFLHLTSLVRQVLIRFRDMETDKQRNVISHAVNVLTSFSNASLTELMNKVDAICDGGGATNIAADGASSNPSCVFSTGVLAFEGWNVVAIDVLLRYLHFLMDEQQSTAASPDKLMPVLTLLIKCARANATMRHYIRSVVLPPLKDASRRPEVGNELRNHLCRYLTTPGTMIRDLSAELLFTCCKENVGRMIKYTGFGNAAGMFANRGLLDCRRVDNPEYSSDSESSDTEEYRQVQHEVNPVVGCVEPTHINPFEGMSEERKEVEAMELVKLLDKLHKTGIVQPCRVGEDGKPQPIDHILQLQEELPQQQLEQKRKT